MHTFTSSVTGPVLTTLVLMSNLHITQVKEELQLKLGSKEWSCHAFSRILLAQPKQNSEKDCVEENTAPAQSTTKSCTISAYPRWNRSVSSHIPNKEEAMRASVFTLAWQVSHLDEHRCPRKVSGLLFWQMIKIGGRRDWKDNSQEGETL